MSNVMDVESSFILLLSVLVDFASATTCSNGKHCSVIHSIYIYNIHLEVYIILLHTLQDMGRIEFNILFHGIIYAYTIIHWYCSTRKHVVFNFSIIKGLRGIQLSSGKTVGGMLFADDFVGISDSKESLQKLLDVVYSYCSK